VNVSLTRITDANSGQIPFVFPVEPSTRYDGSALPGFARTAKTGTLSRVATWKMNAYAGGLHLSWARIRYLSKSRKKAALIFWPAEPREHEQEYCGGKLCLSKATAYSMIKSIKHRQHRNSSKVIPKRPYPCPDCGCYHLTHLAKYDEPYDFDC